MTVVGWDLPVMQGQSVVERFRNSKNCCVQAEEPVDCSVQELMMGQTSVHGHLIEESLCLLQVTLFVVDDKQFGRTMGRWVKIVV